MGAPPAVPDMDSGSLLLGDPPVRDDDLANAAGLLLLLAGVRAAVDAAPAFALPGPLELAVLGVAGLVLLAFAAGSAYRGGGVVASLALALAPVLGALLVPTVAAVTGAGVTPAPRTAVAELLVGVAAAVAVGVVGFLLGVGARRLL